MNKQVVVSVAIVIATIVSPMSAGTVAASPGNQCDGPVTKTIHYAESDLGIEIIYNFTFDKPDRSLCVSVENRGERPENATYSVIVDNSGLNFSEPELEPGEKVYHAHELSPWLSIFKNNHTVDFGARGEDMEINFTYEINASSPDIPSPEIRGVEVVRDSQNNSTSLRVSTYNPTERPYGFYVQAETFGTKGVYQIGTPPANQTEQVILPLRESPDEVIAGKVRIFHKWGVSNGMYDQKEFMSRPNETVNAWDVAFTRVPGTVDEYDYHNESAARYREGYVDDDALPPLQKKIGAALVAVLCAVALWRRRKNR